MRSYKQTGLIKPLNYLERRPETKRRTYRNLKTDYYSITDT
jgi:hypothetical protein